MNQLITGQDVQNRIYRIRGQQVMLDADLAELYAVPTKSLNLAVRRNPIRFPEDFMFQLSSREVVVLRFQIETSSWGDRRYLPYAFTEEGIAMLSSQDVARRVEKLEGKVSILDTDVRLMAQDVDDLKKIPRSAEKRVKGFSKE